MSEDQQNPVATGPMIYLGLNGRVIAIDKLTGKKIWDTPLVKGLFNTTGAYTVSIIVEPEVIFAGCNGHVYAIDAQSGMKLWENKLEGMGYGILTIAAEGQSIQFTSSPAGGSM